MNPIHGAALALLMAASQPIAVYVPKLQAITILNTTAEVRIPRHVDNLGACVELSGPKEDLSCWEMNGDHEPPVFTRPLRGLLAGRYRVQARLLRGSKILYSNVVYITVHGEEEL